MDFPNPTPLGKGTWHPAGSVTEADLLSAVQGYRRRVASAYRSVKPTELAIGIIGAPFHVSPKVDGELWFLVLEKNTAALVSSNGKAIAGDIPLLAEAKAAAAKLAGRAVIAGELFAASAGKGRPRVGDVGSALAGGAKASVDRLGFMAFDLVEGLLALPPQAVSYAQRFEAITDLLGSGKRAKPVRTDSVDSIGGLPVLFAELVEGGKAEGLVVRSAQGTIYKIKPEFTIDAVIIGYTGRAEDPEAVRTLLLGLTREDGRIQIAGHCGNLGGDEARRSLMTQLRPLITGSSFRCPSSSGELFTFVRPECVAEINVTDLQPETGVGKPVQTMVLDYAEFNWKAISPMPSASWLHPVLVRLRGDKTPGPVDTRFSQILERCLVDDATGTTREAQLPPSSIIRREVWTKETKGKVAVRKLVTWKTNKESIDPSYPAFVLHWTDYSAGRGTPLDREVRTAPTESLMHDIAEKMVAENIKKGWETVG
jgi:hypothetical protein